MNRFTSSLVAPRAMVEPDASAAPASKTLVVGGTLHRDLLRLGVVPCAAAAIALTGWFTVNRLDALAAAFDAEGRAVARQVAAMSDLSLNAGDMAALQNIANAALLGGQMARVEISNNAGIFVSAGRNTASMGDLRMFSAPVQLREGSRAGASDPASTTAAGESTIGVVQAFRDTGAHAGRARARSAPASASRWWCCCWPGPGCGTRRAPWRGRCVASRARWRRWRPASSTRAAMWPRRPRQPRRPRTSWPGWRTTSTGLAERLQRNQQISEEQVRDATAVALQRMAEAEQAALSRARFLAAASHDLRQPLHAMGLFIDGLLPGANAAQRPAVLRLQESSRSSWACCWTTCSRSRGSMRRC